MNQEIQVLPIDKIVESKTNPRRHFDPKKLEELAESIKADGKHKRRARFRTWTTSFTMPRLTRRTRSSCRKPAAASAARNGPGSTRSHIDGANMGEVVQICAAKRECKKH